MKKKSFKKELKFEYYEDDSIPEQGIYKGGPVSPRTFDNLIIKSYSNGKKYQIHIKGSKKSLEALGKYLINLSNYTTVDPDHHTHFDEYDNIKGNSELIIHHPNSNWNG